MTINVSHTPPRSFLATLRVLLQTETSAHTGPSPWIAWRTRSVLTQCRNWTLSDVGNSARECKIQLASSQRSSGQTASVTPLTGWNSQLTVLSTPKEGLRPPFALGSISLPLSFRPWLHDDWSAVVSDHAASAWCLHDVSVVGGCFRSCWGCLMADESVIGGCLRSCCEYLMSAWWLCGCFRSCCECLMADDSVRQCYERSRPRYTNADNRLSSFLSPSVSASFPRSGLTYRCSRVSNNLSSVHHV